MAQPVAEPLNGPQQPHLDRSLAYAEHGRRVGRGQILQMPKHQDLAVALRQLVQGGPDPRLSLGPAYPGTWPVLWIVHQALGQGHGGYARQRRRFFSRNASLTRPHVVAVSIGEPVPSQSPQPGVEGDRSIAEVSIEPAGGVSQGFLDYVGRVDPGGQPPVETDGHHAT